MKDKIYVPIGKIGKTYGVLGWVKIYSYMENPADILSFDQWFLSKDETDWQSYSVEDSKVHCNALVAKISGFDSPETVRTLTGLTIGIPREVLPTLQKEEYYWSDLEGLTVIDQNGQILGKVIYLLSTGSNDVLIVKGAKEMGIPYLPGTVVLKVDLEKQEIHVNWDPV